MSPFPQEAVESQIGEPHPEELLPLYSCPLQLHYCVACRCTAAENKALQEVVTAAQRTVGGSFPSILDLNTEGGVFFFYR